jgi:DNA-binding FadR family transcriptional regulator
MPAIENPATRLSLAEGIGRELEAEVMGGQLTAGQRLGTKEELRHRFGVALATMSEAIKLLEMRGLLATRPGPGGGVFVTDATTRMRMNQFVLGYRWSEADAIHHHTVRNALEPLVCRHAARERTAGDLRELETILERMRGTVTEPFAYLRQTWALHRSIAQICENLPLRSIYLTVLDSLEHAVEQTEIDPFDAIAHLDVHRELVAAIAEGPGDRLDRAIRTHELRAVPAGE